MNIGFIKMNNNEFITMIVCWKRQQRFINLNSTVDLNQIEKSIIDIYHLQQSTIFDEYQIQYYDENYQAFIDLCLETIQHFQQLIKTLQSSNAPSRTKLIWRLQMIPKAKEKINYTSHEPTTGDTYNHLREKYDDITCSSYAIINNEQLSANESSDSPLKFYFQPDVANHQRKQYESDMGRKLSSTGSYIGGVFLKGTNSARLKIYPTIHFQIPAKQEKSSWILYVYVLTECDKNGSYYLHGSKGIYDDNTMVSNRFGPIPDTNLVNPIAIKLSENDIKQGKHALHLRVINIRNLSILKRKTLQKFPELNYFMIYDDTNLKTNLTTTDLNFSSEKYHIGCILVNHNRVQDRCISELTADDRKEFMRKKQPKRKYQDDTTSDKV